MFREKLAEFARAIGWLLFSHAVAFASIVLIIVRANLHLWSGIDYFIFIPAFYGMMYGFWRFLNTNPEIVKTIAWIKMKIYKHRSSI